MALHGPGSEDLSLFTLIVFAMRCCSAQLQFQTKGLMPSGKPLAEVSDIRLTTGAQLTLICRFYGGLPDWLLSANPSNASSPMSAREMPEFKTNTEYCPHPMLSFCRETTFRATFQPYLAGLYTCNSVTSEPFIVMWINATVTVDQLVVKKSGAGRPLNVTCNLSLLPAATYYGRQVKWYVINGAQSLVDVSECCTNDYSVYPGVSPGPAALLIKAYNVSRDSGGFRCVFKVDYFGTELYGNTRIYAEASVYLFLTIDGLISSTWDAEEFVVPTGKQINITCVSQGNPRPYSVRLNMVESQLLGDFKSFSYTLSSTISIAEVPEQFNESFHCETSQEGLPFAATLNDSKTWIVISESKYGHTQASKSTAGFAPLTTHDRQGMKTGVIDHHSENSIGFEGTTENQLSKTPPADIPSPNNRARPCCTERDGYGMWFPHWPVFSARKLIGREAMVPPMQVAAIMFYYALLLSVTHR